MPVGIEKIKTSSTRNVVNGHLMGQQRVDQWDNENARLITKFHFPLRCKLLSDTLVALSTLKRFIYRVWSFNYCQPSISNFTSTIHTHIYTHTTHSQWVFPFLASIEVERASETSHQASLMPLYQQKRGNRIFDSFRNASSRDEIKAVREYARRVITWLQC
jgi:hypothetical protein